MDHQKSLLEDVLFVVAQNEYSEDLQRTLFLNVDTYTDDRLISALVNRTAYGPNRRGLLASTFAALAPIHEEQEQQHKALQQQRSVFRLQRLLKHGGHLKVNAIQNERDGSTALHYACLRGLEDVVDTLLSCHTINVNIVDKFQRLPLHWAASYGDARIAKKLLARGANVNARSSGGYTPLHFACKTCADKEIVNVLLACEGIDINAVYRYKNSAILLAAKRGAAETVRKLLSMGANVNDCNDVTENTVLINACRTGHENVVNVIFECATTPVYVNSTAVYGVSALHHAARIGSAPIVRKLLQEGADINCTDIHGDSILHFACRHKSEDVVDVLLEVGIGIEGGGGEGAATNVTILNINRANTAFHKKTPLHVAAQAGCAGIVKKLLMHGADVNAVTSDKQTALHYACVGGYEKVVDVLLANGETWEKLDVNAKNSNNETPMACVTKLMANMERGKAPDAAYGGGSKGAATGDDDNEHEEDEDYDDDDDAYYDEAEAEINPRIDPEIIKRIINRLKERGGREE